MQSTSGLRHRPQEEFRYFQCSGFGWVIAPCGLCRSKVHSAMDGAPVLSVAGWKECAWCTCYQPAFPRYRAVHSDSRVTRPGSPVAQWKAAPWVVFGSGDEATLDRIPVDVLNILESLGMGGDVSVIVAALPELLRLWSFEDPRGTLLEDLQESCDGCCPRLVSEEVYVLGHEDVGPRSGDLAGPGYVRGSVRACLWLAGRRGEAGGGSSYT